MQYHVSPEGSDTAQGGPDNPFRTIGHAAQVAMPGDIVIVHDGVRPPIDQQTITACLVRPIESSTAPPTGKSP